MSYSETLTDAVSDEELVELVRRLEASHGYADTETVEAELLDREQLVYPSRKAVGQRLRALTDRKLLYRLPLKTVSRWRVLDGRARSACTAPPDSGPRRSGLAAGNEA